MTCTEVTMSNGSLKSNLALNGKKQTMESHSCVKKTTINVDELLEHQVGACGLWQWSVLLITVISAPSMATFPVFVNSVPDFRCHMEPAAEEFFQQQNLTFSQVASIVGPRDNITNNMWLGCTRYKRDWTNNNVLLESLQSDMNSFNLPNNNATENCPSGYIYQTTKYQYPGSIVTEYNLVCARAWFRPLGTSIFLFGMCAGFVFGGWAGDKFGRRNTGIAFSLIELVAGLGVTLAPNHHVYHTMRTIVGFTNTGKASVLRVIPMEITLGKYRGYFTAATVIGIAFTHRSLMAGFAWFISNWRWLNLICMSPGLFSLLFFFLLPESPRWLVSQARIDEAINTLRNGHRINQLFKKNKTHFDVDSYLKFTTTNGTSLTKKSTSHLKQSLCSRLHSYIQDNRPSRYTFVTLLIAILLFTAQSLTFFGIVLYAESIKNYIYLVTFINSLTAIPGPVIASIAYRLFRFRRTPLLISYGFKFAALIIGGLYALISQGQSDLVLNICCNVALTLSATTMIMLTVYVAELFPSNMRARAIGFSTGFGRIGSTLATFVNELDNYAGHGVPIILYSVTSLVQIMLLLFLRDTCGENLPDTVLSVEKLSPSCANGNEKTESPLLESSDRTSRESGDPKIV